MAERTTGETWVRRFALDGGYLPGSNGGPRMTALRKILEKDVNGRAIGVVELPLSAEEEASYRARVNDDAVWRDLRAKLLQPHVRAMSVVAIATTVDTFDRDEHERVANEICARISADDVVWSPAWECVNVTVTTDRLAALRRRAEEAAARAEAQAAALSARSSRR